MDRVRTTPAVAADAAGVTEIISALESSLYGRSAFAQTDLEAEWCELDMTRDVRVVGDGERIVGYSVVHERGELGRVEGYVHPDAHGRGIGTLIARGLEDEAVRRGARRIRSSVHETDAAAGRLLESLGYGARRVFREMRIALSAPPPAPHWPEGVRAVPFDPERDARDVHAAHREAFADAWGFSERLGRVSPLRARRHGPAARLGGVREGPEPCRVSRAGTRLAHRPPLV